MSSENHYSKDNTYIKKRHFYYKALSKENQGKSGFWRTPFRLDIHIIFRINHIIFQSVICDEEGEQNAIY